MKPSHNSQENVRRIGIYMGAGASHSWLWFVDLLEKFGFYDLTFMDERAMGSGSLKDIDALMLSGGDTFAIAQGLGEAGARELEAFIHSGGLYIGSCAGAYLPLNSSKKPLNLFNFVSVKINNLASKFPYTLKPEERYCTPYGCSFIFHPVREEVWIEGCAGNPFFGQSHWVPLYGGPIMLPSEDAEALAFYRKFGPRTAYLIEEEMAREVVLGKVAAVRKQVGQGCLYLFGPHFEHPSYAEGNQVVVRALLSHPFTRQRTGSHRDREIESYDNPETLRAFKELKKVVSNIRIVAMAMDGIPMFWKVGQKTYTPEHLLVFTHAIWKRLKAMPLFQEGDSLSLSDLISCIEASRRALPLLKGLREKASGDGEEASSQKASDAIEAIRVLSASFLSFYFSVLRRKSVNPHQRIRSTGNKGQETLPLIINPEFGGLGGTCAAAAGGTESPREVSHVL